MTNKKRNRQKKLKMKQVKMEKLYAMFAQGGTLVLMCFKKSRS